MISPHGTEHPHGTHDISHMHQISPTVLNIPYGTQDIPHGTHDIPHGTEHPHGTAHPPRYCTHTHIIQGAHENDENSALSRILLLLDCHKINTETNFENPQDKIWILR